MWCTDHWYKKKAKNITTAIVHTEQTYKRKVTRKWEEKYNTQSKEEQKIGTHNR
jgi:hypothetical protein